MLHAVTLAEDGATPVYGAQLEGAMYGGPQVQQLKQALRSLAQAAGWPAVDPGTVDVNVDYNLIRALGAVVGNLAGVSSLVKAALQTGAALALTNPTIMQQAQTAVINNAQLLTSAVQALILKYTAPSSPPPPPAPSSPAPTRSIRSKEIYAPLRTGPGIKRPRTAVTSQTYPPGTIAAQAGPNLYRVAVPRGLGSMGDAYQETTPSATVPPGAQLVSLPEFEKQTGQRPWYKSWVLWGVVGGVAVVGTGAFFLLRR